VKIGNYLRTPLLGFLSAGASVINYSFKEQTMSNLGDQILSSVSGGKDLITNLISKVPGFSGYIDRQERRTSDRLLRETIAARFEQQWGRVSQLQQEFISTGNIMYLDDLERAAIKLRTFADRVRTATRGYSGFFDAVKVNEDELNRLLQYDNALLDMADEVSRAIDHVQAAISTEGVPAAIRNLTTVSQQCIDAYNRREEVLLAVE
jgi:hypothetical protein